MSATKGHTVPIRYKNLGSLGLGLGGSIQPPPMFFLLQDSNRLRSASCCRKSSSEIPRRCAIFLGPNGVSGSSSPQGCLEPRSMQGRPTPPARPHDSIASAESSNGEIEINRPSGRSCTPWSRQSRLYHQEPASRTPGPWGISPLTSGGRCAPALSARDRNDARASRANARIPASKEHRNEPQTQNPFSMTDEPLLSHQETNPSRIRWHSFAASESLNRSRSARPTSSTGARLNFAYPSRNWRRSSR